LNKFLRAGARNPIAGMAETPQQLPRTLWLGVSLLFGVLGLTYLLSLAEISRVVKHSLPVLGQVADFTLTNQDGKITTLADLTNHVWVADIIFTRCAGPCPRMTGQMKSLQDSLPQNSNAKLVTLTTDPDYDTPPIMKRYGERFNADFNRWTFLTGTKKEIAALASGSLKLGSTPVKLEDQKDVADLFIHTTIFVIVDKHAQLRGIFETGGDDVDWTNAVEPKLLATVRQLEREP
jgi:protein SCO1/2